MGTNNMTLGPGMFYINNTPICHVESLKEITAEEIVACENKPILKLNSNEEFSFTCEIHKRTWYKLCGLKWYQVLWIEFKNILNKYFRWCKK